MGIRSDLDRIIGAKAALKTALEGKGVTVPSPTLIDGYPALVEGIDTSGIDTSDATATANDLLYGVTGYGASGQKLTGTGTNWRFIKLLYQAFMNSPLAGEVVIYAPNASVSRETFSGCSAVTSLILTFDTFTTGAPGGFYNTFAGMTSLTHLTLYGSTEAAIDFRNAFYNDTLLSVIDGDPLNLTGMSASFTLILPPGIVEVRFVPSTIKVSNSQSGSPLLSTASLLSLANGLDAAAAPKTLTMHATSKTNMDNINVDVVDGVAILGTTKTLTQFITTDKGWTIA